MFLFDKLNFVYNVLHTAALSSLFSIFFSFFTGPGLKPPAENTLQYLEEVAVQTAKYVTKNNFGSEGTLSKQNRYQE